MANATLQIAIKPKSGQNVPPVLQKLLQKQQETLQETGEEDINTQISSSTSRTKTTPTNVANEQKKSTDVRTNPAKENVGQGSTAGDGKKYGVNRNSQVNIPQIFLAEKVSNAEPSNQHGKIQCNENRSKVLPNNAESAKQLPVTPLNKSKLPTKDNPASSKSELPAHSSLVTNGNVRGPGIQAVHKGNIKNDSNITSLNSPSDSTKTTPIHSPTRSNSSRVAMTTSESSSSTVTKETGGIDYRSKLRPTPNSVLNESTDKSKDRTDADVPPPLVPRIVGKGLGSKTEQGSSVSMKESSSKLSDQGIKKVCGIVERKSDSKKFKKIILETASSKASLPAKPELSCQIDLTQITQQYHKIIQSSDVAETEDDIYVDATSVVESAPSHTALKTEAQRVSLM